MTPEFAPHLAAMPTPTTTLAAEDGDGQHPVAAVLEFLFLTHPGQLLLLAVVLGLLTLFWPPIRLVLGPIWRFLTGGLVLRTPGPWDATWLDAAPDRPQSRPNFRGESFPHTRWGRMPGYQRMIARWGIGFYLWALYAYPLVMLILTALVVVTAATVQTVRLVHDWGVRRTAGLFAAGAAGLLGYGQRDPARWIAVPRQRITRVPVAVSPRVLRTARRIPGVGDRLEHALGALWVPVLRVPLEDDGAEVLIRLDADLTNRAAIKDVETLAKARLPEGPWEATHKEKDTVIRLFHPKRPPASVVYTADQFNAYAIDNVPIGQSATGWETLPLKELAPHTIISASTGWCKTTTCNVYVAHTSGNGGFVMINDPKRVGFVRAFGDLPNIRIRTTVEGWVDNVTVFNAELHRRYQLIERFPEIQDNPEAYFQPWFLVTDERGSYVSEIKSWWKNEMGEKGLPEVFRLEKINLWQGRAAAMYVLDAAQQANLDVFLDSDGRDNRMNRLASGPQTRSSWMMLFPGHAKVKVLMKKGRAMLGIGPDSTTEIQLARLSDEEARAFAKAGAVISEKENIERAKRIKALIESAVPAGDSEGSLGEIEGYVPGQRGDRDGLDATWENDVNGSRPGSNGDTGNDQETPGRPDLRVVRDGQENITDSDRNGDSEDIIIGLRQAAEFLEINEETFKKARQRRPIPGETRRGDSPAWAALDLKEWRTQAPRNRPPASSE